MAVDLADEVAVAAGVAGARDREAEAAREAITIRAAQRGDARAFRELVEAHHRGLYQLALRLVGDASEADDLVQETFAKAYVHLDRFDGGHRISTWLHRIALNTCRDYLKSARRRERASGADPVPTRAHDGAAPDEALTQRRREAWLHAALDKLKPSYREALVLKDLSDLSYPEIHAITDVPITALKIRVLRARARLRALLSEAPL